MPNEVTAARPAFPPRIDLHPKRWAQRRAHRRRFLLLLVLTLSLTAAGLLQTHKRMEVMRQRQDTNNLELERKIHSVRAQLPLSSDRIPSRQDMDWLSSWLDQRTRRPR